MGRPTDDLIRIAAAGGGFTVDARALYGVDALIRIVAAGQGKCRIVIQNARVLHTDDLIQIAAAGQGSVMFEL